jgi:hypothetical protein
VVDDVDAVRQRLEQAGYSEGMVVDPHPYRKRIYFLDNNKYVIWSGSLSSTFPIILRKETSILSYTI